MVPSVNSITFWRVLQKHQMAFRLQIKLAFAEIEKTIIDFQLVVLAGIRSKSFKFFRPRPTAISVNLCRPERTFRWTDGNDLACYCELEVIFLPVKSLVERGSRKERSAERARQLNERFFLNTRLPALTA